MIWGMVYYCFTHIIHHNPTLDYKLRSFDVAQAWRELDGQRSLQLIWEKPKHFLHITSTQNYWGSLLFNPISRTVVLAFLVDVLFTHYLD